MFGKPVIEPSRRRARKIVREMAELGPDSRPAAIQLELTEANDGVAPVEQTIQERYPHEIGEIRPDELEKRSKPGRRVQLYPETDLLADGEMSGYGLTTPADPQNPDHIEIDDEQFELTSSHRIRIFGR